MRRVQFTTAGLMAFVLTSCLGLASLRYSSRPLASLILLLTLGIMSMSVLGVVYRRGIRRASWLGFSLFGWGYMALASGFWWEPGNGRPELVTTLILDKLDAYLQISPIGRMAGQYDPRNSAILLKLEEPITMSFPTETRLEDVLKYVKQATRGHSDSGIPIYVDPVALHDANKTLESTVIIDVEGVPLKSTLVMMLKQLGLIYDLQKGVLVVTTPSQFSYTRFLGLVKSYHRIGHCFCALLAALLGALAGRVFFITRDQVPG